LAVLPIACVALAACGSASKSSTSSTTTAAAGDRRAQFAACMKKQGFNLPQRPPGGRPGGAPGGVPGFGFGGGGNAGDPKFQAALRKCGANFSGRRRAISPAMKTALPKFVACVRKNGYNLPDANTSGNGPVFDPSKVNQTDPKFQAAARKCQSLLPRPTGPPNGGAPPAGA
jgi:hypothetical protein